MSLQLRHAGAFPRWRPSATLLGSIGLHCAAGIGTAVQPEIWPWALGAVAGNHTLLGALGLWPRSRLLGANVTRLPEASRRRREVAVTFDDGPDPEVTPRVLDLLDAHGVRATFFCIAAAAQRHPELCREIARRGHAVENHSHVHQASFPLLGLAGFRREIGAAQAILAEVAGTPPRFFRAPAGLRNPLLDPVLHELGLTLASWTRRGYDTRDGDARRVHARLVHGLAAGDILLLHDGHVARDAAGRPVVLDVLPRLLRALADARLEPVVLRQAIDA